MKQEYYQQLQESKKRWHILSDVDVLGSMSFWTTTVTLDSFNISDLDPQSKNYEKAIATAIHEYTHFLDYTSTLWGLKNLKKINEAYMTNYVNYANHVENQPVENYFFKQKEAYDMIRAFKLPSYYTEKGDVSNFDIPWRYQLSCGQKFDNNGKITKKPIIFCNFQNSDGQKIVRSPLSPVSLLEVSAISQEYIFRFSKLDKNKDSFLVDVKLLEQELIDFLYNPDLTEYSIVAHLLSTHINVNDHFLIFSLMSLITRIAFNFPKKAFDRILSRSSVIEKILNTDNYDYINRIKNGLKEYDFCIIAFLLIKAATPSFKNLASKRGSLNNIENLDQPLKLFCEELLGLFAIEYDWFLKELESEVSQVILEMKISPIKIPSFQTIIDSGYANFDHYNLTNIFLDFNKLRLPKVILEDSNEVLIFPSKPHPLNLINSDDLWKDLYTRGESRVMNFVDACIGV